MGSMEYEYDEEQITVTTVPDGAACYFCLGLLSECESQINKLLPMIDQMMMSRWVHMPPTSGEYFYYQLIRGIYEGRTVYSHRKTGKQFYGKSGMSSDVSEVTGILYEVHFEDTSLSSALVKPENLRITFVLPNEE